MNKSYVVPSETISRYSLKNGQTCVVVRKYKDHLHTIKGITTRRELVGISVSGNAEPKMLDEVKEWMNNKCGPPIPKFIKLFMGEQNGNIRSNTNY